MFPIASPEINQSHTCSRPLGRWRRPSTLLAFPRVNSCAGLVKSQLWPGDAGILQASHLKKGSKAADLPLLPCPAPSCACVSASTGAWTVEEPPAPLSSARRRLGNGLSLCNKKIFLLFLKFSITFSLRVCVKVPRSDWNCSTIEITENKLMGKKELTILFISIFKRKKVLMWHHIFT